MTSVELKKPPHFALISLSRTNCLFVLNFIFCGGVIVVNICCFCCYNDIASGDRCIKPLKQTRPEGHIRWTKHPTPCRYNYTCEIQPCILKWVQFCEMQAQLHHNLTPSICRSYSVTNRPKIHKSSVGNPVFEIK